MKSYPIAQRLLLGSMVLGFALILIGYLQNPPSSAMQVYLELQFLLPASVIGKAGNLMILASGILLVAMRAYRIRLGRRSVREQNSLLTPERDAS